MTLVRDRMSSPVVTVDAGTSVEEVVALLVVERRELVGIASSVDLVGVLARAPDA